MKQILKLFAHYKIDMIDHRIVTLEREHDPQQREAPYNESIYRYYELERQKISLESRLEDVNTEMEEIKYELEGAGFVL